PLSPTPLIGRRRSQSAPTRSFLVNTMPPRTTSEPEWPPHRVDVGDVPALVQIRVPQPDLARQLEAQAYAAQACESTPGRPERDDASGLQLVDALATIPAGERAQTSNGKPGLPRLSRDGTIYLHDNDNRASGLRSALEASNYGKLLIAATPAEAAPIF